MGLFWDLIQQSQISSQQHKTYTLEQRVENLENELYRTRELLSRALRILEEHLGKDIDGDGRIG